MNLPSLLVVTEGELAKNKGGRSLAETVVEAESGGARAFLFREKYLERQERYRLASRIASNLENDSILIVASDPELADEIGADGVHLSSSDPPVNGGRLVGRSCHDRAELAAHANYVDYLTLSPVHSSISKPGYGPGLGVGGFGELTAGSPRPVFALGGIRPGNVGDVIDAGAHGVAVSGAVMAADDPAAVVADLQAELGGSA